MRLVAAGLFVTSVLATVSFTSAQQPGGKGAEQPGKGGPPGGKGGFGGPGGGFGGKGGFGMPAAPGTVLPPAVREQLKLTDAQKKDLDAIQKDVDAKLEKLLTDEQKKTLKELKDRGARGPGGFGGPGGGFPGGPGGNPPPKKD
ncbi:MAG: hypothetical protein ACKODX_03400 [Gemmata sp.]